MLTGLAKHLRANGSLSQEQLVAAIEALLVEHVSLEEKAEFLAALALKGETVEEIKTFARELRARSIAPPIDPETRHREILDVCGTGGDRLNTFNISTAVAFVAAAAEIPVAKHGNRAITSQAGSADVLEALGVPIDLTPEKAAAALRDHHFAFFFAPKYHPAFKHIAPARRLCAERGQRTIFNIMGPLLNPAQPSAQLVGVPSAQFCEPLGRVLQGLGTRRAMIVSGRVGDAWLDELSALGENMVAEFYHDRGFTTACRPLEGMSFQPAKLADLAGGDRKTNAEIIRRLFLGQDRGPKRDAVLLNSAAALFVAGKSRSLQDGWELAERLLDSGKVARKLAELSSNR